MARIVVTVALALAACGTRTTPVAEPVPPPTTDDQVAASQAPTTAPPPEEDEAEPADSEPPAPMVADTPLCRAFKKVVDSAGRGFSGLAAKPNKQASKETEPAAVPFALPGAKSCTIIAGGPGHSATSTYTCEFGTAEAGSKLAGKRDQLASQIRSCGSKRALAATRVRLVDAAGKVTLVVNVHDHARW